MKKVMTIVGTRPELIRLSLIVKKLDEHFEHQFVHTGQNFDKSLHDQFFDDLSLRRPDVQLNQEKPVYGFEFIGNTFNQMASLLDSKRPDVALILGDTNSGLSAYVCKQKKIPVFHMEAGNRCYNDEVPEEVNRRIIDSCSEYLLTYTSRSREQLLLEGYPPEKVIVVGNPIHEVLSHFEPQRKLPAAFGQWGVSPKKYVLVTLHRNENVSDKARLSGILQGLASVAKDFHRVVLSVHPKLAHMIEKFNLKLGDGIIPASPFSFTEFIGLMKDCALVLSDSGTVPEEATILKVPCVLLRTSTERPELLESNAMLLSGVRPGEIVDSARIALKLPIGEIPADYRDTDVSDKIVKLLNRYVPGATT